MSILTGSEIRKMLAEGRLHIDPFDDSRVQPNSYDVTLSDRLRVYTGLSLDPRQENPTEEVEIPPCGFLLQPGVGYLGSTVESTGSAEFVAHIDGKSSLGRLFLSIHATAGRGDLGWGIPGPDGEPAAKWTVELAVMSRLPVRVYAGMKIGQVSFHTARGERQVQYVGRYLRQQGPTSCRMHLDREAGLWGAAE